MDLTGIDAPLEVRRTTGDSATAKFQVGRGQHDLMALDVTKDGLQDTKYFSGRVNLSD